MQDKFYRKITYARLSVTDLCNFRCVYCMAEEGVPKKSHDEILTIEQFERLVDALCLLKFEKIRLTGGEPLIRKGVEHLIEYIGRKQEIEKFGVTTNGANLEDFAQLLKKSNVTSVNVSLDTLKADKFFEITRRGKLENTIKGIEKCKELGLHVKTNTVLMKGINDDEIEEFIKFSQNLNLEVRFIELMPMCGNFEFYQSHFLSNENVLQKLCGFREVNEDSKVAKIYEKDGARIGVISPITSKFCQNCNRMRFTADGFAMNCLHDNERFDIKDWLFDVDELARRIEEISSHKKLSHELEKLNLQGLDMNEIGG